MLAHWTIISQQIIITTTNRRLFNRFNKMGLGVLEDTKLPHVPGTVILDDGVLPDSFEVTGTLKHAKGKNGGHIVLNPQPSDDPNDPLVRLLSS